MLYAAGDDEFWAEDEGRAPGWATVRVERGPKLGYDHYPVIATLRRVSDTKDPPALAPSNPVPAR